MNEIEKMEENITSMRICTTISPELKHTINDKLAKNGLKESGTISGWCLKEDIEPIRCSDFENRWHYVCIC